jgi:hypothetical protein
MQRLRVGGYNREVAALILTMKENPKILTVHFYWLWMKSVAATSMTDNSPCQSTLAIPIELFAEENLLAAARF